MFERVMLRLGWVRVSTMTTAVAETAMDESRERARRREVEKRLAVSSDTAALRLAVVRGRSREFA